MERKWKKPHIKRPSIMNINKQSLWTMTTIVFVVEHEWTEASELQDFVVVCVFLEKTYGNGIEVYKCVCVCMLLQTHVCTNIII